MLACNGCITAWIWFDVIVCWEWTSDYQGWMTSLMPINLFAFQNRIMTWNILTCPVTFTCSSYYIVFWILISMCQLLVNVVACNSLSKVMNLPKFKNLLWVTAVGWKKQLFISNVLFDFTSALLYSKGKQNFKCATSPHETLAFLCELNLSYVRKKSYLSKNYAVGYTPTVITQLPTLFHWNN